MSPIALDSPSRYSDGSKILGVDDGDGTASGPGLP